MSELVERAKEYLDAIGEGDWAFQDSFMRDLVDALEEAERENERQAFRAARVVATARAYFSNPGLAGRRQRLDQALTALHPEQE